MIDNPPDLGGTGGGSTVPVMELCQTFHVKSQPLQLRLQFRNYSHESSPADGERR